MLNPDGSRKYSYRLQNPNGPLPTEAFVKSRFSIRKNQGAKVLKKKQKDKFEEMSLEQLKQEYMIKYQVDALDEKRILESVLEIDDAYKYGEREEGVYDFLTMEETKIQCGNRSLPKSCDEVALRMILRSDTNAALLHGYRKQVSQQFDSAVSITKGFEDRADNQRTAKSLKIVDDEWQTQPFEKIEEEYIVESTMENKELFRTTAGIRQLLLECDDKLRFGHINSAYTDLSNSELKDECQSRYLPISRCKTAALVLLRAKNIIDRRSVIA